MQAQAYMRINFDPLFPNRLFLLYYTRGVKKPSVLRGLKRLMKILNLVTLACVWCCVYPYLVNCYVFTFTFTEVLVTYII